MSAAEVSIEKPCPTCGEFVGAGQACPSCGMGRAEEPRGIPHLTFSSSGFQMRSPGILGTALALVFGAIAVVFALVLAVGGALFLGFFQLLSLVARLFGARSAGPTITTYHLSFPPRDDL